MAANQQLGMMIADARKRLGLRQIDLASGLCSPAMISAIENGHTQPSPKLLTQLVQRLDQPLEPFFDLLLASEEHENSLLELAYLACDHKLYRIAMVAAGKAIAIAASKSPFNHHARTKAYVLIGRCLLQQGEETLGIRALIKASHFGANKRAWHEASEACFVLADWYYQHEQWSTAYRYAIAADHSLQVSTGMDVSLQINLSVLLGKIQLHLGLYEDARNNLKQAYQLAADELEPEARAELNFHLGEAHRHLGEPVESVWYLEQAAAFYKEHDPCRFVEIVMALADAHAQMNEPTTRIAYLQQAYNLLTDTSDGPVHRLNVLVELARAHVQAKQFDTATSYYQQAIDEAKLHRDENAQELALRELAILATRRGLAEEATRLLLHMADLAPIKTGPQDPTTS